MMEDHRDGSSPSPQDSSAQHHSDPGTLEMEEEQPTRQEGEEGGTQLDDESGQGSREMEEQLQHYYQQAHNYQQDRAEPDQEEQEEGEGEREQQREAEGDGEFVQVRVSEWRQLQGAKQRLEQENQQLRDKLTRLPLHPNGGTSPSPSLPSSGSRVSRPSSGDREDFSKTYGVFVGDLSTEVGEAELQAAFEACGEIHSVHIFREPATQEHKGFGFVNFITPDGQSIALTEPFRNQILKGRPVAVSPSEQKQTLFVGNLPKDMNQEQVRAAFVDITGSDKIIEHLELKTEPPPGCESRGFCFVQFVNHNKADMARKLFMQTSLKGRPLNVSWSENKLSGFTREVDEETMAQVKTLYVSNIAVTVTDQILTSIFAEFGPVQKAVIVKHPDSQISRGFAFVEYIDRESAVKAMEAKNNSELAGQRISVVLAKPPPKTPPFNRRGGFGKGGAQRGGGWQVRGAPRGRGGFDQPRGGRSGFDHQPRGGFGPSSHAWGTNRYTPYSPQAAPVHTPVPAVPTPATYQQSYGPGAYSANTPAFQGYQTFNQYTPQNSPYAQQAPQQYAHQTPQQSVQYAQQTQQSTQYAQTQQNAQYYQQAQEYYKQY